MVIMSTFFNQTNVIVIQIKFNNKSQTEVILSLSGGMFVCGGK